MLVRPVPRAIHRTVLQCRSRHISTRAEYHPKVRALPFVLSKDEAIEAMNATAALHSWTASGTFKALVNQAFSFVKVPPQRPFRIQAVYLPTWIVDAEVEARMYGINKGENVPDATTVTSHIMHSFLPGFVYDPLSRLCFGHRHLLDDLQFVPWSKDLRTQYGEDVLCLPYTLSPLSLLKNARSLARHECEFGPELRFDPGTVRAPLLAAYPVLMPVYVASYQYDALTMPPEKYTLTLAIDASILNGTIYADARDGWAKLDSSTQSSVNWFIPSGVNPASDIIQHGGDADNPLSLPSTTMKLEEHLNRLFVEKMTAADAKSMSSASVNMDDLRVQPWNWDASLENNQWVKTGVELRLAREAYEELTRISGAAKRVQAFVVEDGKAPEKTTAQAALGHISNDVTAREKNREENKPQWLRAFEKAQTKDARSSQT